MAFGKYPFGLIDAKIYPLTGDTPGTAVDLPAGRVLEVSPEEDEVTLEAYNGVVQRSTTNTSYSVSLEYGGLSLEVLATITGGTVVVSGVAPNQKKTLEAGSQGVARPYVMIIGKALDNEGGDAHIKLFKANFDLPSAQFNTGEYNTQTLEGRAVRNDAGKLIAFIQNETAVAIAP